MADLAACYFCGAALDDSLATVSLGDGPDAPTLTLCVGCKEKLETVLAAVDREPDSGSGSSTPADSIGEPDTGTEPLGTEPSGTGDPPAENAEPRGADSSADPTASSSEPRGRDATADPGDSDAGDAAGSEDEADAGWSEDEDDTGESDDEDNDGRSIVEGDQAISALEYNKVMRLLQNREFPVDREEIVTVAANAYQVARADCDRVIEVAIDRGILEEANGQLLKPD